MNDHPHDSLPAFVLDALDPEEALQVTAHLSVCPACRADAEEFRAAITMLPYSVPAQDPPPRVKRQLFARIAADRLAEEPAMPLPGVSKAALPAPRWLGAVAALLVVSLVLVALNAQRRIDTLSAQLDQSRREIQWMRDQMQYEHQKVSFVTASETLIRTLQPTRHARGAWGKMYVQRGYNRIMLSIGGLRQPERGMTYQCWFASSREQVPAGSFEVRSDGTADFFVDAPAPIENYTQFMVTVERSANATRPGDAIVLWASLRD